MDRSLIQANLDVSGFVVVEDRDGKSWTVELRRPTDPTGNVQFTSMGVVALAFSRLERFARRDRRWLVELRQGHKRSVGRPIKQYVIEGRDRAAEQAVELAADVQLGRLEA